MTFAPPSSMPSKILVTEPITVDVAKASYSRGYFDAEQRSFKTQAPAKTSATTETPSDLSDLLDFVQVIFLDIWPVWVVILIPSLISNRKRRQLKRIYFESQKDAAEYHVKSLALLNEISQKLDRK